MKSIAQLFGGILGEGYPRCLVSYIFAYFFCMFCHRSDFVIPRSQRTRALGGGGGVQAPGQTLGKTEVLCALGVCHINEDLSVYGLQGFGRSLAACCGRRRRVFEVSRVQRPHGIAHFVFGCVCDGAALVRGVQQSAAKPEDLDSEALPFGLICRCCRLKVNCCARQRSSDCSFTKALTSDPPFPPSPLPTGGTNDALVCKFFPPDHGGAVSSVRVRDPPPPLPALRAHLVTKGQWLLAIHMVAPKAPENFVPFAGDPRECKG